MQRAFEEWHFFQFYVCTGYQVRNVIALHLLTVVKYFSFCWMSDGSFNLWLKTDISNQNNSPAGLTDNGLDRLTPI